MGKGEGEKVGHGKRCITRRITYIPISLFPVSVLSVLSLVLPAKKSGIHQIPVSQSGQQPNYQH